MLQAMNTGHDGSLTTIHANCPRDALARIETLVLMAGFDLPLRAIREQISGAFDLIIHTQRLVDGRRRVTHITEVGRMEGDVITLQDIFIASHVDDSDPGKLTSKLTYTGVRPGFLTKLETQRREAGQQLLRRLRDGREGGRAAARRPSGRPQRRSA